MKFYSALEAKLTPQNLLRASSRAYGRNHGVNFKPGGSVLAVIEVLISSIDYERKHLPVTFPKAADYSYGYSIYLAWFVFTFILISGFSFMIFSRKRKGDRAPTEELAMADEPTIIGR